jgi:hypothetical protein
LVGGFGVELGDAPFGGVVFGGPAAPTGQHQRDDAAGARADAERGLDQFHSHFGMLRLHGNRTEQHHQADRGQGQDRHDDQ